jgi:hypothetical protein
MIMFATGVGRVLSRLSFSDRVAIAAEQAALDWHHETAQAPSSIHRVWCAFRFGLALCRISAAVAALEVLEVARSAWLARLAFWLVIVTWMSFSPAGPSRENAEAENVIRWWLALEGALFVSPALAVWTARSRGGAPVFGLALLGIIGAIGIMRFILPPLAAGTPGWSLQIPSRFVIAASAASILMVAIAERTRTDRRRWLVNSVLGAAVIFPIIAANAAKIAVWLNDAGIITGDVVYLPQIPARWQAMYFQSAWPKLGLLVITLAWLIGRHSRLRQEERSAP